MTAKKTFITLDEINERAERLAKQMGQADNGWIIGVPRSGEYAAKAVHKFLPQLELIDFGDEREELHAYFIDAIYHQATRNRISFVCEKRRITWSYYALIDKDIEYPDEILILPWMHFTKTTNKNGDKKL